MKSHKYFQIVFLGTFMTGAIALSKAIPLQDIPWFEKIGIVIVVSLGGLIVSALVALLIWAAERLKAYRASSRVNTLPLLPGPRN